MISNFKENLVLVNGIKSLLILNEDDRPLPSSLLNALISYDLVC